MRRLNYRSQSTSGTKGRRKTDELSRLIRKGTKGSPGSVYMIHSTIKQKACAPSVGIRAVWSVSLLWEGKDPMLLHADNEDSDHTGWIPKLIWVFAGRTGHLFLWNQIWIFLIDSEPCWKTIGDNQTENDYSNHKMNATRTIALKKKRKRIYTCLTSPFSVPILFKIPLYLHGKQI